MNDKPVSLAWIRAGNDLEQLLANAHRELDRQGVPRTANQLRGVPR